MSPSRLEERAVPLILHGKDVVVETADALQSTNLLVLPLFQRVPSSPHGVAALVVAATSESVKRIGRQIKSFSAESHSPTNFVQIGIDENIRREIQLLSKPADVVIATPERLIDHIRRENVSLRTVRRVLIELPDDYEEIGFDKDIQFIYSKLPTKVQTVLACSTVGPVVPLAPMLKHPQVMRVLDSTSKIPCRLYQVERDEAKGSLLADVIYALRLDRTAVVCRTSAIAKGVGDDLIAEGLDVRVLRADPSEEELGGLSKELAAGVTRVVVLDSPKGTAGLPAFRSLVLYQPPDSVESYVRFASLVVEAASHPLVVILHSREESTTVKNLQEVQHVDPSNAPSPEEVLRGRIASIVKRIRESENPEELNRFRALVRSNVPFFLRGYFAAFLLKESLGKLATTPQGEMKTLFVSIGKNRKVFPRDLSRLFSGALQVKSTAIGNIKVLDNYSFVDLPEPLADKAIGILDGSDFRGRKITVNHARKREEKEA